MSTECKRVPLQYKQYIWIQISLDELKAAKCEPGTSDDIHEAQASTSDEGNIDTQPSTSQHPTNNILHQQQNQVWQKAMLSHQTRDK